MSISFIKLECPACGASLSVEEGRKQVFCSYCGTKILVNDENEYVFRHVDEADLKRAESERIIKLKELELEEKRIAERRNTQNSKRKTRVRFTASFFLAAFFLILIGSKIQVLDFLRIPGLFFFIFGLVGMLLVLIDIAGDIEEPQKTAPPSNHIYTTIVDNSVNVGVVNQRNYQVQNNLKPKNKWVAFFLCLFFGIFGAHKFYEGKPLLGVLYILTIGLLGIGWFVDLIILLFKPREYYGR